MWNPKSQFFNDQIPISRRSLDHWSLGFEFGIPHRVSGAIFVRRSAPHFSAGFCCDGFLSPERKGSRHRLLSSPPHGSFPVGFGLIHLPFIIRIDNSPVEPRGNLVHEGNIGS